MTPVDGLSQAWRWSVRKTLSRWVRPTIKPEDAAAAIAARPNPVCYVLDQESQADLAVLDNTCRRLRLPSPERRLGIGGRRVGKAYLGLHRRSSFWSAHPAARAPPNLTALGAAAAPPPEFEADLGPWAICWGSA